jgi:FKBP-type peptidyl-prolyl cis-trans isomerase 2
MSQAKPGDTVQVHYTGKLKDGTVFDSSRERSPLEIKLGAGQVISGFEQAIEGMVVGETKTIDVPMGEAYGERQDDKIVDFDRSSLPGDVAPQVGQKVQLQTQGGQPIPAVIAGVTENSVKVDANHPLAGHDLVFDLELMDIT